MFWQRLGFVFTLSFFIANFSHAASYYSGGGSGGIEITLSTLYDSHATSYVGGSPTTNTNFHNDIKIGTTYPSNLYLGVIYTSLTGSTIAGASTSANVRIGYGITCGYHNAGYYLNGSYLLNSSLKRASGEEYSGGSAYIAEFGYNTMMTGTFFMGVGLVYKSFAWSDAVIGSTKIGQANTDTDFYPSLNIGFVF